MAAARHAASLSTPSRKSTIASTSWWLRIADASSVNDVGSGTASTNEPRPWNVSTRPSARSRVTASRTTVRDTPYSSISSASDGSLCPGPAAGEDPRLEPGDDALGEGACVTRRR